MYCNNPYNYFRQQGMNVNQMDNMQDMGQQMPQGTQAQQPFFNQMPTMPMQPMIPMGQMGQMPVQMPGTMGGAAGVGAPFGTTTGNQPTTIGAVPLGPAPIEQPIMDTEYTQGYLRTQIGKRVKVEFLIGTNMLVDREGTLVDVGISYIIINEVETDDLLLCDIYSIKFVRFYF